MPPLPAWDKRGQEIVDNSKNRDMNSNPIRYAPNNEQEAMQVEEENEIGDGDMAEDGEGEPKPSKKKKPKDSTKVGRSLKRSEDKRKSKMPPPSDEQA